VQVGGRRVGVPERGKRQSDVTCAGRLRRVQRSENGFKDQKGARGEKRREGEGCLNSGELLKTNRMTEWSEGKEKGAYLRRRITPVSFRKVGKKKEGGNRLAEKKRPRVTLQAVHKTRDKSTIWDINIYMTSH